MPAARRRRRLPNPFLSALACALLLLPATAGAQGGAPGEPPLQLAGLAPAPDEPRAGTEPAAGERGWHATEQLRRLDLAPGLLSGFERPVRPVEAFIYPVNGRLTSTFGWRNVSVGGNRNHGGIDLAAPAGTPVVASRSGTVIFAGWAGAYGYAVYVDHPEGLQTRYAHLSSFAVSAGQSVAQGQQIGMVGSTGASTGPHLHFEIRIGGVAVDPLPRLQSAVGGN